MSTNVMSRILSILKPALFLLVLLTPCRSAFAAKVEKPPAGMAKYLVVLWEPGTPIPGDKEKGYMKRVAEPDWAKHGGRLLASHNNQRVVYLPLGLAKKLREDEGVASFQRIWAGESLAGWDESDKGPNAEGTLEELTSEPESGEGEELQWQKSYLYDPEGNITDIGGDHYTYDGVGRLTQATVSGKTETYRYDAFGNLIEKSITGSAPELIAVDPASNRLSGVDYDAAGNVTTRPRKGEYGYDSLNMVSAYKASYPVPTERRILYDANDERIGTLVGTGLQRWTIRDFDGQIIREFTGSEYSQQMIWSWKQDHIRGQGQLVAGESLQWFYSPTAFTYGGKRHYHLDHLGSVRAVTDNSGRSISAHDYFPFGVTLTKTYQEQINWGDPQIDGMRFAGHWRDFLGQLDVEGNDYVDYMHARYYDPNLGRFLSIDPGDDVDEAQPQTWNKYAYARNDPAGRTDPTGMYSLSISVIAANPQVIDHWGRWFLGLSTVQQLDRWYQANRARELRNAEAFRAQYPGKQILNGDVMFGGVNSARKLLGTGLTRERLLAQTQNPRLRELIGKLFREDAKVWGGGTADAIRYERLTGVLLSKNGHVQKGHDMTIALNRVLISQASKLTPTERRIVQELLLDLADALN